METVGVRELRQYATRVLARVKRGETVGVTDRGILIAQINPVTTDPWEDWSKAASCYPRRTPNHWRASFRRRTRHHPSQKP